MAIRVPILGMAVPKEFLFPFKRKSDGPLVIYLNKFPAKDFWIPLVTSFPKASIGKHKNDLISLDLPGEFRNGKIIAAYGPKGTVMYDLIDKDALRIIESGGDNDIFVFQAFGNYALVSLLMGQKVDTKKAWDIVKQLAGK